MKTDKTKIAFADLTHTSKGISSLSFPYGISLVAAHAIKTLPGKIDTEIFKYPEDLRRYLENNDPKIVCFSNFSWTIDISNEFAKKIKEKNPRTITIFGGPNFPLEQEEQERFLNGYTGIDVYIKGEGERAFEELFLNLEETNFHLDEFKRANKPSHNCFYLRDGKLVQNELLPRIESLDETPSPYLTGMLDKFFDGILIANIQTVRGCPFTCSYCQEGQDYFCPIARFSLPRLEDELDYIAQKKNSPNLIIADSNFGMYPQDLETCESIASLKKRYYWPKYIEVGIGKNLDIVSKAVEILHGEVGVTAPVQSTDEVVLQNIKRRNISMDKTIKIAKSGEKFGANSLSEVILCLPGDNLQAHVKSMCDMMDIGINVVRSHQLLMLTGSEISNKSTRKKFGMITRFRIQPRCFGSYNLFDAPLLACEVDEICVGNDTMRFDDYLECRSFDLTVEIFYNNGIFQEVIGLLTKNCISASSFIRRVHKNVDALHEVYEGFIEENNECLWESKEELLAHIKQPEMMEKYIKEERRNNEQLKYRALAFFHKMKDLHNIAFSSAKELLDDANLLDSALMDYLDELHNYCIMKKDKLLFFDNPERKKFKYDFFALEKENFKCDPSQHKKAFFEELEFFHSQEQKENISNYLAMFGSTLNGLGSILSRSHANKLYKSVRKV